MNAVEIYEEAAWDADHSKITLGEFEERIRPLYDVEPVKHGQWILHKPFDNGRKNCNECIECSQCHTWFGYDCYAKTPYCPNCGAKMDGERKE